jgi:MinD-like ATPase involved in chromosome partitioning or flagellar assembly
MPDAGESQPREGQIVTFYSFKGGTGRTMALANVAWILAANGMRVLIADWDLESPGLHRFFQPFLDPKVSERPGIVDFIRRYEWEAIDAGIDAGKAADAGIDPEALTELIEKHIDQVENYAIPLNWQFPDPGALHFLSSGRQTNGDYQSTVGALDWDNFYNRLYGGQFFDALRALMKRNYDYVLIDSRTGLSDVADICTVHLPDVVVDCFTLATQGIDGAAMIAKSIQEHTERDIVILPVPMRIDHAHEESVEAGLALAAREFEKLPAGMPEWQRREYWAEMEVPYQPAYAYEETLAAFGDRPGSQAGLLPHYEQITARITGGAVSTLPPREEWVRLRTRLLFSRTQSSSPLKVLIDFSPEDQLWAEWIAAVLARAEIAVLWVGEMTAGPNGSESVSQTVMIVSDSYISRMEDSPSAVRPDLLISVTDTRLPPQLADVPVIFLDGLSETQAEDTLIDRLKGRRPTEIEARSGALRYPGGDGPAVVNAPARNVNFTGRGDDLRGLREELRSGRLAVARPLAILGPGGVGKTQVALEFAHRFKADYDVIWWMNCSQSQYIDSSLTDLGKQLREKFGVSFLEEGSAAEVAQQLLKLLSEGLPDRRWLLVYDNAEDIDTIKGLLPSGGGHVLITSRREGWKELGRFVGLDVFKPEESVSHLRRRMHGIAAADAARLAAVLGNMPLAVAAAGALLASADIRVPDYLRQLEEQQPSALPEGDPLGDYPSAVAKAWHLSLDQLAKRSAAAARLLGICSVMASDISLDLIYSQAMADALRDLDATISEPAMMAGLIRQIDLLALIKLDNNTHQIQVHSVVQTVVRQRMAKDEEAAARRSVHRLLVAARPDGSVDDPEMWPRYRLIWPHLTPSEAQWSTEEPVRQLLIERVRYLRQRDDLERGRRRAEGIETSWKIMLDREPAPEMAKSLQRQLLRLQFNLANIKRDLAQFEDSRAIDEAVLQGQRALLGEEHQHTLQTRSSLAGDLRALGDYQAALDLDLETYKFWSSGCGEEYRGTLSAAHNLALSYLLIGDFKSALAQDRLTYERRVSVLGSLNPRTLDSGAAIGRELVEAGRYKEAVARLQAVWTEHRGALGDNNRATLNARLWLGIAMRCAGNPEAAAEHVDAASIGLSRGFGSESSDALACRLSQALNWLAMHRIKEATNEARQVLAVYEGRLGQAHPHSLICRLDIATALCMDKNYSAAVDEAGRAADGLHDRLGAAHPYTLAANAILASALASEGRLDKAEEIEEPLSAERGRVLGPQHPDSLRSQANLLLTRHQRGVEGASRERQAVIDAMSTVLGAEHPDVSTVMSGGRLLCMVIPQPF